MAIAEMSEAERQRIADLINAKVPNASNCMECGQLQSVNLAVHLVTPIVTSPVGGIQLSAESYPQAMAVCQNCGFTRYFNVIVLQAGVRNAR